MSRYWRNRLIRHVQLGITALSISAGIYAELPPPDVRHRVSMASAYVAIIYLVASLGIGPYRVWRKTPNPVSLDLRRDIGIWAGLLAVLHTVVGLTVHMRGRMWMYFLEKLHPPRIQISVFGFANYLGGIATLLFLLLLLISNDLSLRRLGTLRWKSIQRWSYIAFALIVIHGFAYQYVEKRDAAWVAAIVGALVLVAVVQIVGFVLVRRTGRLRSKLIG